MSDESQLAPHTPDCKLLNKKKRNNRIVGQTEHQMADDLMQQSQHFDADNLA